MAWSVEWDDGFVVGGVGNVRLTPNFRLDEFRGADASVRIHRELVSAIQILRDKLGRPIGIVATDPDGLGVTVRSQSVEELAEAATQAAGHHLFDSVDRHHNTLHVRIAGPGSLPGVGLEQVLETAFSVTSAYETAGDRFQQVTGNFDGAGLSFGPAQWNFKSGTLVPLFREFEEADQIAFRGCFADEADYDEWQMVMGLSVAEQIAWGDARSSGRGKHDVVQPWKSYLQAVGRVHRFRSIMVEQALRKYGARLLEQVRYLQSLAPDMRIDHLRCICALYDLVIQQGSLKKARSQIEERVKRENPTDQFELVRIAVEERAKKANPRWRDDVLSRRLGILRGFPTTVGNTQRTNINSYMLRDVRLEGVDEIAGADMTVELSRVSDAIAAGDTLLA